MYHFQTNSSETAYSMRKCIVLAKIFTSKLQFLSERFKHFRHIPNLNYKYDKQIQLRNQNRFALY